MVAQCQHQFVHKYGVVIRWCDYYDPASDGDFPEPGAHPLREAVAVCNICDLHVCASCADDLQTLAVYRSVREGSHIMTQQAFVNPALQQAQQQVAVAAADPYAGLGLSVPSSLDDIPQRLVCSVAGFENTGKTHFALTGRDPVVIINLDVGTEGVAEKFQAAGKRVYTYDIALEKPTALIDAPDGATQMVWQSQWRKLTGTLEQIYALHPGTVVIDTMTETYELVRLAHFGKTDQVMPNKYGPVFAEMRAMVRMAYAAEYTTTVFTHKMGKNFDTGLPEVKGWKDMDFLVQVNLQNDRAPNEAGHGLENYYATIRKCRQNPHASGMMLMGENFSLQYLGMADITVATIVTTPIPSGDDDALCLESMRLAILEEAG